ncbi:MAG: DUF3721 domain-containing protein [Cyanobacteriota bacterium]|nr:DUF3721 domain-containing protein [Cyanobacteriota bacterium]
MNLALNNRWSAIHRSGRRLQVPALVLLALGAISSTPGGALVTTAVAQTKPANSPIPATYATRAEAEKAAKEHFQCTGAHQMGQHWMPCAQHSHDHGSHP